MMESLTHDQILKRIAEHDTTTRSKIQQIFQLAGDSILSDSSLHLSEEQKKLIIDIQQCRTSACGFRVEVCTECGTAKFSYNSCGNRNCPVCGTWKKEAWIDARASEVIDAPYYHAVFTCPHELSPIILANQKLLYSLYQKCVGKTIVELAADEKYLGAKPGVILVLHTWNQELLYHPHVHALISGGGLAADGSLRTMDKDSFFIPESVLSAMFRGKFLDLLEQAWQNGDLILEGKNQKLKNPYAWKAFRDSLYQKKWVAHVKETFNGKGNAIEYLGRYVFKAAISDYRILNVTEDCVTITVRGKDGRQSQTASMTPGEFIRRFLLHVLPKGFQKVRYYGFLANGVRKDRLTKIFNLQGYRKYIQKYKGMNAAQIILARFHKDIRSCPCCGKNESFVLVYEKTRSDMVRTG